MRPSSRRSQIAPPVIPKASCSIVDDGDSCVQNFSWIMTLGSYPTVLRRKQATYRGTRRARAVSPEWLRGHMAVGLRRRSLATCINDLTLSFRAARLHTFLLGCPLAR